ncbi:MAG TPA: OmpA family protein [Candidatus Angelobacter sp.]|nr:OmpA family protein [Candidatus Angelobacter sp.]
MKINQFCAILLAIALAVIITGCHHNTPMTKTNPQPPTITPPSPSATLAITPDTVDRGQPAELSWKTQNATTVTIEGVGTVSASGSRKISPANSTTYHLTAKGDGGSTDANARITVNIPTDTTSRLTEEQLFEQNVKDIFFNYDNYDIRPDEVRIASANADFLAKHPDIKLVIEGHCDERGSEDYNMGLGENRASVTKETLVRNGVSADRIKVISFGKERPFCTTAENESCFQQNRRAHFVFSN